MEGSEEIQQEMMRRPNHQQWPYHYKGPNAQSLPDEELKKLEAEEKIKLKQCHVALKNINIV
ncbi:4809_t:CDS:2, partial [Paraglomus occultum]